MKSIQKLTLASIFLALGLLLPFVTGNIPQIGNMLLPMHLPVLMCGFICGWQYGALVGFITPLLRCLIFSLPPMPFAIPMAFELATYGITTGLLVKFSTYLSLVISMIAGRLVWGFVSKLVLPSFTWKLFLGGALLEAIPGIIIQIILVPVLVMAWNKFGENKR